MFYAFLLIDIITHLVINDKKVFLVVKMFNFGISKIYTIDIGFLSHIKMFLS